MSVRIAVVCSAHGFGHLTRQLAIFQELRRHGVEPVFLTTAPASVIEEWLPGAVVVYWRADVGILQSDSLTEDHAATDEALSQVCHDDAIDALAATLRDLAPALVVADCPPTALEAARRAGIPAIAIGNFTWPWIYRNTPRLAHHAARLEAWQSPHPAISLWPGPGMMGFASVTSVGLVGRHYAQPRVPGTVLVSFGGLGLGDLAARLPELPGVTWWLAPPMPPLPRPDCVTIDGLPYPALVSACDVVLTKPGYGIFAEAALAGTPLVWLPRGAFPEAPYLVAELERRGDRCAAVSDVGSPASWRETIAQAVTARRQDPRPPKVATDQSAVVADLLLRRLRETSGHRSRSAHKPVTPTPPPLRR